MKVSWICEKIGLNFLQFIFIFRYLDTNIQAWRRSFLSLPSFARKFSTKKIVLSRIFLRFSFFIRQKFHFKRNIFILITHVNYISGRNMSWRSFSLEHIWIFPHALNRKPAETAVEKNAVSSLFVAIASSPLSDPLFLALTIVE